MKPRLHDNNAVQCFAMHFAKSLTGPQLSRLCSAAISRIVFSGHWRNGTLMSNAAKRKQRVPRVVKKDIYGGRVRRCCRPSPLLLPARCARVAPSIPARGLFNSTSPHRLFRLRLHHRLLSHANSNAQHQLVTIVIEHVLSIRMSRSGQKSQAGSWCASRIC